MKKRFEELIAANQSRQNLTPFVSKIMEYVPDMITSIANGTTTAPQGEMVQDVMYKLPMYQYGDYELRLHYVLSSTTTQIHNHTRTMYSLLLGGTYTNTIWGVIPNDRGAYQQWQRTPNLHNVFKETVNSEGQKMFSDLIVHTSSKRKLLSVLQIPSGIYHSIKTDSKEPSISVVIRLPADKKKADFWVPRGEDLYKEEVPSETMTDTDTRSMWRDLADTLSL